MGHTVPVTVPPPAEPTTSPISEPRLVSGEAVELDIRVARAGSRVPALLIDIIVELVLATALITGASAILALLTASGRFVADATLTVAVFSTIAFLVLVGYPATVETLTRGRTLGKLAMGLRVVRDDGGPIRFRQAVTRALVGVALEWPGVILPPLTWLASLWTIVAHRHGKRLGDLAAGTIVIHERAPQSWGWVPAMPPALTGWARTLDLVGLDDDLALAVRHFLSRNRQLKEPARSQLGYLLARQVAVVTNPPAPPGTPGWAYLAAVIAERHRRAAVRLTEVRRRSAVLWGTPPPAAQAPAQILGTGQPMGPVFTSDPLYPPVTVGAPQAPFPATGVPAAGSGRPADGRPDSPTTGTPAAGLRSAVPPPRSGTPSGGPAPGQ